MKLVKARTQKIRETHRKAQKDFAAWEPRSLRPKQATINHANVTEVENFWGGGGGEGICGSYKSEHAAVAGWCNRVRELEAGSPGHLPERREAGWGLAVKRMPSWKAPGTD